MAIRVFKSLLEMTGGLEFLERKARSEFERGRPGIWSYLYSVLFNDVYVGSYVLAAYSMFSLANEIAKYGVIKNIGNIGILGVSAIGLGLTMFGMETYETFKTIYKSLIRGKQWKYKPISYCSAAGHDAANELNQNS